MYYSLKNLPFSLFVIILITLRKFFKGESYGRKYFV